MKRFGFGLSSRYALAHLVVGLGLLLAQPAPAGARAVAVLFGFPLADAVFLLPEPSGPQVSRYTALLVTAWVLNACLCGATLGLLHRSLSAGSRAAPGPSSLPPR